MDITVIQGEGSGEIRILFKDRLDIGRCLSRNIVVQPGRHANVLNQIDVSANNRIRKFAGSESEVGFFNPCVRGNLDVVDMNIGRFFRIDCALLVVVRVQASGVLPYHDGKFRQLIIDGQLRFDCERRTCEYKQRNQHKGDHSGLLHVLSSYVFTGSTCNYPLTVPIITPFTKYLWING